MDKEREGAESGRKTKICSKEKISTTQKLSKCDMGGVYFEPKVSKLLIATWDTNGVCNQFPPLILAIN